MNHQERELATVGALAGIGNVNAQLTSHLRVSMNTGLTAGQLQAAVDILETKVSRATGSNARQVLETLLRQK